MPKSRNRKNHKKKVQARNTRIKGEQKKMMQQMEELQKKYVEEMAKKAKESEDSGEVPFTLDSK
tara:strand:+ start:663 stop:854 length:192 start_codon:yes stop_codon:yes gene_type:complete